MSFLVGVALTVVAYAFMPPHWASRLSWMVRDAAVDVRLWWKANRRTGGE